MNQQSSAAVIKNQPPFPLLPAPSADQHPSPLAADAAANDGASAAAASRPGLKAAAAIGAAAFLSWLVLYQGSLLLNDMAYFNGFLEMALAHAATLIVCLVVGSRGGRPSRPLMPLAAGLALCLATLAPFAIPAANLLAAPFAGAASALLACSLVLRLSGFTLDTGAASIVGGQLIGLALLVLCGFADDPLVPVATACACAAVAGIALSFSCPPPIAKLSQRTELPSSWRPYVAVSGTCCFLASVFAGVALNPYIIQSQTISAYWIAIAFAGLALLGGISAALKRTGFQSYFLAPLVGLIVGLYLFSSGAISSIILPIAIVLAAETGLTVFSLLAATAFARLHPAPLSAAALGSLLGTGIAGNGFGELVHVLFQPNFIVISGTASACLAALAVLYVVISIKYPGAFDILANDFHIEPAPKTVNEIMREAGLSDAEVRVGLAILDGGTYRDIGERLDISERTVKYHASNILHKMGMKRRNEFERAFVDAPRTPEP